MMKNLAIQKPTIYKSMNKKPMMKNLKYMKHTAHKNMKRLTMKNQQYTMNR